jgi:hypothetical protein
VAIRKIDPEVKDPSLKDESIQLATVFIRFIEFTHQIGSGFQSRENSIALALRARWRVTTPQSTGNR